MTNIILAIYWQIYVYIFRFLIPSYTSLQIIYENIICSNIDDLNFPFFFQDRLTKFCLTGKSQNCTTDDPMCSWQPPGVHLKRLILRSEAENDRLCLSMVTPEIAYTEKLYERQWSNDRFWSRHLQILLSKIGQAFKFWAKVIHIKVIRIKMIRFLTTRITDSVLNFEEFF